jgi:hypothetical protein
MITHHNSKYKNILATRAVLGVFAKLRKATITFTVFVCLSVKYTSVGTGRIFLTFDTGGSVVWLRSAEKIQVLFKPYMKQASKTKADLNS